MPQKRVPEAKSLFWTCLSEPINQTQLLGIILSFVIKNSNVNNRQWANKMEIGKERQTCVNLHLGLLKGGINGCQKSSLLIKGFVERKM